jgi:hypothetical protein
MKKIAILCLLFALSLSFTHAQILPNYGGERAGLSALSFLKNDLSTRSLAMGGASVALSGDGYSAINNPAALVDLENTTYALSHLFLGGGVNQSLVAANYPLSDKVSTLSFSVNSLNSGEMEERTEFMPQGTGRQVFVTNLAIGATYSRQLSSLFSAGVTVKYIYEGIANYSNSTATVDLAFLYNTDFKDLKFAVMIQNFGGNSSLGAQDDIPVTFNRNTGVELDANTVPTVFRLGLSITPYKTDMHSLSASAQLNHPNDNAENYSVGVEYNLKDLFFARAGYRLSVTHQDFPTFGIGIKTRMGGLPLTVDYAANPTNFMGMQHGLGVQIGLLNNNTR